MEEYSGQTYKELKGLRTSMWNDNTEAFTIDVFFYASVNPSSVDTLANRPSRAGHKKQPEE